MLLGSLVGTAAAALPEDRRARVGILAAMELANSRWRDGANQEEAASVAGMGVTRFKSLFKQATAGTSGNRNPSDAAAATLCSPYRTSPPPRHNPLQEQRAHVVDDAPQ